MPQFDVQVVHRIVASCSYWYLDLSLSVGLILLGGNIGFEFNVLHCESISLYDSASSFCLLSIEDLITGSIAWIYFCTAPNFCSFEIISICYHGCHITRKLYGVNGNGPSELTLRTGLHPYLLCHC